MYRVYLESVSFDVKDNDEFNVYLKKILKPVYTDNQLVFYRDKYPDDSYVLDYLYKQNLEDRLLVLTNVKILKSYKYIDYINKLKAKRFDELDVKLFNLKIVCYNDSDK